MAKITKNFKNIGQPNEKYQVSVYLEPSDAESVKILALLQEISLSSVVANLVKESLKNEKYQTAIQGYQQFKKSLA